VEETVRGVYALGGRRGGRVRAYLVDAGAFELTLVDTLPEPDGALVLAALDALGRSPRHLRHIALTHAHRGHLGGLAALKRASGASVYAEASEADVVAGRRPAQGPRSRWSPRSPRLWPHQLRAALGGSAHDPVEIDWAIAHGDEVGPLQVIGTPGHTPGHLSFHWPERGVVIAGDAITTWPSLSAGWDATILNREQHALSLRRLARLEARAVCPGHGDAITQGAAAAVARLVAS
jgi:glyoxylase-like metal-dependent hydrolase (beta-lactamase superfamily II)